MLRTPPDPETSALAALKEAETEAREAQQELDAKRQELKSVKAGVNAAAARLTEAQERVKTRWVLLVGESVLNAVERQLLDFKGKKRQWFNLLNPVLDTDIKPDDRVLYDNWKQRMQKLGATEDDAQSDTDATVGKESKDASASSGESQDHPSAGSDSKGSSVSSGEDPSTSSDSKGLRKPIIGWKPVRLDDNSWGSKLTGKAVADLPEELDGAPIVVTDSKGETWETRIEEVVSRDGKTVIVRDTGNPEQRMQKLVATEDDAQSDTDATVGRESKDASASSGESQDHPSAGSDSKGSSVSSDAQNASASSGEDPSTSSDSKGLRKPIIGWKPVRLDDNSWGSKLTGKAVADLPEELDGAPIVVTDSKGETWETRIEEVVSRDGKTVIVRDTGKPEARDDGPHTA